MTSTMNKKSTETNEKEFFSKKNIKDAWEAEKTIHQNYFRDQAKVFSQEFAIAKNDVKLLGRDIKSLFSKKNKK